MQLYTQTCKFSLCTCAFFKNCFVTCKRAHNNYKFVIRKRKKCSRGKNFICNQHIALVCRSVSRCVISVAVCRQLGVWQGYAWLGEIHLSLCSGTEGEPARRGLPAEQCSPLYLRCVCRRSQERKPWAQCVCVCVCVCVALSRSLSLSLSLSLTQSHDTHSQIIYSTHIVLTAGAQG